ncbi:MAG: hypothetical protein ACFFFH_05985 [Candidatus Thorarchaeota archaeon]
MAIRKDQALTVGQFFPSSDKNVIYHCYLNDTAGFLKDFIIFSLLIGFFTFLIMQFLGLIVVLLSWVIIIPWLVPKHYKFIQINKHVLAFGTGSFLALLRSYFKEIYVIKKFSYNEIYHLRLDRWYSKKRGGIMDSFGRVEVKINDTKQFHILIHSSDLTRLVKILETHRFQSKVHKSRSRDQLLLIFPPSPNFSESGS